MMSFKLTVSSILVDWKKEQWQRNSKKHLIFSFVFILTRFSRNMFRSVDNRHQLIILPLVKSNYKEVAKEGIIFSLTYEVVAVAERA